MNRIEPTVETLQKHHERLARAVTKIIVDYVSTLDSRRVASALSPAELLEKFTEPLPEAGVSEEEILDRFEREVIPNSMQIPSPRYFGLFNPTPLPLGVWADALASAINQNGAAWSNSPVANIIESQVIRWLCELIGFNREAFGTLTSGGSEANLIALKCARDKAVGSARLAGLRSAQADLVVYTSELSHFSIEKSVDIVGIGRASLRKIPTDERFHMRTDLLREAIQRDSDNGLILCCIAAAAGATSTGVIDDLEELAGTAAEINCWFHVDASYGGALSLSRKHRQLLKGIEQADTVTIDPHKWMFVPFACGAVLTRDGAKVLRDSFDIMPEYISESRCGADVEFDFFRYGQLGTRRFNALKIWMTLKALGTKGYAEIIERQIELTHYFAFRLDELDDFVRVGEVETAVCCFRFLPKAMEECEPLEQDRLQMALQQRIEKSGEAWISTTVLCGRRALRVNVNSFLTQRRHMDDLVELLVRESNELLLEWRQ